MEENPENISSVSDLKVLLRYSSDTVAIPLRDKKPPKIFKLLRKAEHCLYCNQKMESKSIRKKFCSDKCRTYYRREQQHNALFLPTIENGMMNRPAIPKTSSKHYLWQDGDPEEYTNAFFIRKGAFSYKELEKNNKNENEDINRTA